MFALFLHSARVAFQLEIYLMQPYELEGNG